MSEVWYELGIDTDTPPDGIATDDVFPEFVRIHSTPFALQAQEVVKVDAETIGDGSVDNDELSKLDGLTSGVQTVLNENVDGIQANKAAAAANAQAMVDNALLVAAKANVIDVYTTATIDTALSLKANVLDVYTMASVDGLLVAKADKDAVYTKTEVDAFLVAKANALDIYTKTESNAALALKADKDATETALALKADQAATEAILALKANVADTYTSTTMDAALDTKANKVETYTKVEVDAALAEKSDGITVYTQAQLDAMLVEKANVTDTHTTTTIDTALNTKADKTETETALATKADKAEIETALATKADQTATNAALALKANAADVFTTATIVAALSAKADIEATETALATKANQDATDAALALKANVADIYTTGTIDNALALKADQDVTDAAFAQKANASDTYTTTTIDNALALKANAADVYTTTTFDAALSTKANAVETATALATKADLIATNAALATKADLIATNAALDTKADQTATAAALDTKANKTETQASLALKADKVDTYTKTQVDAALAQKAIATDVYTSETIDTALATKADKDVMADALSLKANTTNIYTTTTIDAALELKADKDATASVLALKANVTDTYTTATIDSALALKADQDTTDAALALKADQSAMDTALALKAVAAETYTKTEDDAALALKANVADIYTSETIDSALALKANVADTYTTATINTALALKADQSAMDTALALKAAAADTYTKTEDDAALVLKANVADTYTTATIDTALAGKSNTSHEHNVQDLSGAVTDAQVPDDITITEADTLDAVTSRGATTGNAISITNTTGSTDKDTGALVVEGGLGVEENMHVGGGLSAGDEAPIVLNQSQLLVTDALRVSVDTWLAQNVIAGRDGDVGRIDLLVTDVGSCEVYIAATGSYNTPLSSVETLIAAETGWTPVTFSSPANVTSGQSFAIVCKNTGGTNIFLAYYNDEGAGYVGGSINYSENQGGTWGNTSFDLAFKTYLPGAALVVESTAVTIGTKLDVLGDIETSALQVTGGVLGSGKVLTSDISGHATWQEPVMTTDASTLVSGTLPAARLSLDDSDIPNDITVVASGLTGTIASARLSLADSDIPDNITITEADTFDTVTGRGATTTNAVTVGSLNTGQGANELYAMNQNVQTSDMVVFNSVTATTGTFGTDMAMTKVGDAIKMTPMAQPDNTSHTLYNMGGNLYWDGMQLNAQVAEIATAAVYSDYIINGSLGVGMDAVNGEVFGFDTVRLKENNLRINFKDTSASSAFPSRDWRIKINDTTNGGRNYFAIEDVDGGRTPFTIEANAKSDSLVVSDDGYVGIGTADPIGPLQIITLTDETVDQSQLIAGFSGPGDTNIKFQSFTAGKSGRLSGIQVQLGNFALQNVFVRVYAGVTDAYGTGGTLIDSNEEFSNTSKNTSVTIPLSASITAGSQYTVSIATGPTPNAFALWMNDSNPYPGGAASDSANHDWVFQTYVQAHNALTSTTFTVDAVGRVGIGTESPVEALDLHGVALIADTVNPPSPNTNRLYNNGGTLYWNDTQIGLSDAPMDKSNINDDGALNFDWMDNEVDNALTVSAAGSVEAAALKSGTIPSARLSLADSDVPDDITITEADTLDTVTGRGATTANAVTVGTLNTGQGDNELYAMDQDVQTTDNVTFNSVTATTGTFGTSTVTIGNNITLTSGGKIGLGVTVPTGVLEYYMPPENVATGGTASAESAYKPAANAFDGDSDTWWESEDVDGLPDWLKYDLGAGNQAAVVAYTMTHANYPWTPKDWTFQGSNDDSSWTTLDTQTAQNNQNSSQEYSFSNATAYRYYRLYITTGNEDSMDYVAINELVLTTGGDTFVVSTTGKLGLGEATPSEKLDINGVVRVQDTTDPPTDTTDRLYNNGGDIYWNGSALGAGGSGSSNNLTHNFTVNTGETITAGDVVSIINDGKIIKSSGSNFAQAFDNGSAVGYLRASRISDTTFVMVYRQNYSYAAAVVGTISGNTISYGTPVVIGTDDPSYDLEVTGLNSTQFVVVHEENSHLYARVGTVSGTSIAWATADTQLNAADPHHPTVSRLSDTEFVCSYVLSTDIGYAIAAEVSGGAITPGTTAQFSSEIEYPNKVRVCALSSSLFVIAYASDNSAEFYATMIAGTVSGTAVSFGSSTPVQFYTSGEAGLFGVTALSSSSFVTVFGDEVHGSSWAAAGSVTGVAVTMGTPVQYANDVNNWLDVEALSSTKVVVAYAGSRGSAVREGTISGNTISFGAESVFDSIAGQEHSVVFLGSSKYAVLYMGGNTMSPIGIVGYEDVTLGTVLGVADESGVADGTVSVVLTGIAGNQSSLTPGAVYYAAPDGSIGTTKTPVRVGLAISTTELLLDMDR